MDLNVVAFTGNLGADPESKTLPSGTNLAEFRVAINCGWGDKQKTSWVSVKTFGKSADFCSQYLRKGSKVSVAGRIDEETWQAQDGQNRSKIVIVADRVNNLTPKDDSQQPSDGGQPDEPTGDNLPY